MGLDNIITVLTEYLKYRQGRGKKYAEPDTPFDNETITFAIKSAVKIVKATEKFINSSTGVRQ